MLEFLYTVFFSMIPIVELRGGIPFGVARGLDYPAAITAAIIGNMIPVPFIILFIRRIFVFLRKMGILRLCNKVKRYIFPGVPPVAQWVKNQTAAAQVIVAWV